MHSDLSSRSAAQSESPRRRNRRQRPEGARLGPRVPSAVHEALTFIIILSSCWLSFPAPCGPSGFPAWWADPDLDPEHLGPWSVSCSCHGSLPVHGSATRLPGGSSSGLPGPSQSLGPGSQLGKQLPLCWWVLCHRKQKRPGDSCASRQLRGIRIASPESRPRLLLGLRTEESQMPATRNHTRPLYQPADSGWGGGCG